MSFTAGRDATELPPPAGLSLPDMAPGQQVDPLAELPAGESLLQHTAQENEDGTVDLLPPVNPAAADLRTMPWGTNFADHLSDMILGQLAEEVLEGAAADITSNRDHYSTLEDGIEALGLKKERLNTPFQGAAGARSSLMLKSCVRFNASAMAEMLPSAEPVRTQIVGEAEGIESAGQRKQKFLNHHLTTIDEGYYPDFDQGLLLNGLLGSVFRMVYEDPATGFPTSRFRTPFNLVVSYNASESHRGGRYTEIDSLPPAEVVRLQVTGHWRDVRLAAPLEGDSDDASGILRAREGRAASDRPEDAEHVLYTQYLLTEIPGLEHQRPDGTPSGLPLPWRVVVDRDSRDVLRVDRDWDPDDSMLRPRQHFSHYRYMPGLGYYGIGFAHLLAQAADATTTMVRQGLNANTLVSFPGGLRVKGNRMEQNDLAIGPCEFREVDTSGTDIRAAIMPLPYRDVPPSFVPLLQHLNSDGEMLGNVAEQQVGEGRQDAPVGTTLALIEQAVRVESAVMKRMHTAQAKELRLLAKLFGKAKGTVYPYLVGGKPNVPIAPDFANADDIVPVSDPNVPTQLQRLTLAEAKLKLASASPGMFDMRAANEGMLRTAGADDAEIARLMPPAPQGKPSHPIAEFGMALKGEPLAVAPAQMHAAHIQTHMAQAQMLGLPPPIAQAIVAHIGDHLAMLYRQEAEKALGAPLPPDGQPIPPEIDAAISQAFAQAAQAITDKLGPLLGAGAEGDPLKAAELSQKADELRFKAVDSSRKAEQAARQDAGEAMRDTMQAASAREERELAREEMAHEETMAQIEAAASIISARHTTQQAGLTAAGPGPARKPPAKPPAKGLQ